MEKTSSAPPARPGFGKYGRKVMVKANHFLTEIRHCNMYLCFNISSSGILFIALFDIHIADMSTRVFFEPIRVSEYVEKHINKDLTRGLSHQDRIKVVLLITFR
ncbi:hypothetical protein SASPL_155616 [Salvia splendens]|uniref:Uncharacterized protein n=1 Tax=Salvia splendens TaxID=180675 RepID=A0A8X8VY64_SALSN|nr:hypothetical protein SASPL_155616 [Salvia splendens]